MVLQPRSHLLLRNGISFSSDLAVSHVSRDATKYNYSLDKKMSGNDSRGQKNFVSAFLVIERGSDNAGMDARLHPYCQRRSEASTMSDDNASNDASLSLPKRHPGREAGPQSTGSLEDCLATEEAPSAEEPSTFLRGGVCNG